MPTASRPWTATSTHCGCSAWLPASDWCSPTATPTRWPICAAASTRNPEPRSPTSLRRSTSIWATDTFSSKDLVTLLTGQNDVLEQYAQYPAVPKAQLLSNVYEAGLALARQVSRIADAGGKVLVSTVPDLAYSPFAIAENTDTGDNTRGALLGELVAKFNEGLRVGIAKESGEQVAIMLTDELVQAMAKFPISYGAMTNVIAAVCDKTLATTVDLCTTDTLVTGGDSFKYLWADDRHLSPNGHVYLGNLAATRSRANPF
jgi:outer membrane lipase/esterase